MLIWFKFSTWRDNQALVSSPLSAPSRNVNFVSSSRWKVDPYHLFRWQILVFSVNILNLSARCPLNFLALKVTERIQRLFWPRPKVWNAPSKTSYNSLKFRFSIHFVAMQIGVTIFWWPKFWEYLYHVCSEHFRELGVPSKLDVNGSSLLTKIPSKCNYSRGKK